MREYTGTQEKGHSPIARSTGSCVGSALKVAGTKVLAFTVCSSVPAIPEHVKFAFSRVYHYVRRVQHPALEIWERVAIRGVPFQGFELYDLNFPIRHVTMTVRIGTRVFIIRQTSNSVYLSHACRQSGFTLLLMVIAETCDFNIQPEGASKPH
jgi:hypothetical protein